MAYTNSDIQKASQKRYYEANKELYAERNRQYRAEKRAWFEEYKKTLSCAKCGEDHPALLDFHHEDPTKKEIGLADALSWWGRARIVREIEKCQILCCKCHRLLHWEEKHLGVG